MQAFAASTRYRITFTKAASIVSRGRFVVRYAGTVVTAPFPEDTGVEWNKATIDCFYFGSRQNTIPKSLFLFSDNTVQSRRQKFLLLTLDTLTGVVWQHRIRGEMYCSRLHSVLLMNNIVWTKFTTFQRRPFGSHSSATVATWRDFRLVRAIPRQSEFVVTNICQ